MEHGSILKLSYFNQNFTAMRNDREENYNSYNRRNFNGRNNNNKDDRFYGGQESYRRDMNDEPDRFYPPEPGYDRLDVSHNPNRYKVMYDTANYSDEPRTFDYGLPYGTESNDLEKIGRFPYAGGPYDPYQPRRYRYSEGYNPNYDNPEEGGRYRDFDSRGNHGFRHDAAYGNEGELGGFSDDNYGSRNRNENDRNYGYMGGYNR